MSTSTIHESQRVSWARRIFLSAPVRIVLGTLAAVVPVAVVMAVIQHAIDKPYRQVWPYLLAAGLCLLTYRGFVRLTERRALAELAPQPALREALSGAALGGVLVCIVCAVLETVGALHIAGPGDGNLFKPLAEMALAATLEEVLFRAVLFRILAGWLGRWAAWGISALLFALSHLPNNGFSALAFVSLVVAGLMLAAAYMVRDRLWLPIGLHFGWNYTTDGVFGLSSSGQVAHGHWQTLVSGPDWLSGGAFGIEASVVTVAATATVTWLLLWLGHRADRATMQLSPQASA